MPRGFSSRGSSPKEPCATEKKEKSEVWVMNSEDTSTGYENTVLGWV